ncbi:MAG TPA: hypothetical protein VMD59_08215, partial [Acidimicrobiales bacterium]|nr:hypothetical protein [Acidimicrobiales bacterium]
AHPEPASLRHTTSRPMAAELEAMLDPTGGPAAAEQARLAPRSATLRGRRLGLLSNSKPNSAVLLEQLAGLLEERCGVAAVTSFAKPSFAVPAGDELLEEIAAGVDLVIAGVGD